MKKEMIFVKKHMKKLPSPVGVPETSYHQGSQLNSSATAVEAPNTL